MRGTPVKIACAAKIPRLIWVEKLVVLWVTMVMNIKICKDWPNLVPRVLSLLRESRERTLGTRLRLTSFQWNEFHSKYSSNSKQRWVRKWRPSKINYNEVIKWSNFTSVILVCLLTLFINHDIFLCLIVENPFDDEIWKLSFELLPCSLKRELHPFAII